MYTHAHLTSEATPFPVACAVASSVEASGLLFVKKKKHSESQAEDSNIVETKIKRHFFEAVFDLCSTSVQCTKYVARLCAAGLSLVDYSTT